MPPPPPPKKDSNKQTNQPTNKQNESQITFTGNLSNILKERVSINWPTKSYSFQKIFEFIIF